MACLDLVYDTSNRLYQAGSSQKSQAGLARLGPETKSKSELGSAWAPRSFEFLSCARARARKKWRFMSRAGLGLGGSGNFELDQIRPKSDQ